MKKVKLKIYIRIKIYENKKQTTHKTSLQIN